jgi:hypothetical protein
MPNTARKLLLGLLGGSSSFSPLSIPGLALWLDASDASTLFQASNGTTPAAADGAVVGYWADKSGAGNHVTQSTTGNKPTLQTVEQNGRSVVRFDLTNDGLAATFGSALAHPLSVWMVVKLSTGGIYLFDNAAGGAGRCTAYVTGGNLFLRQEFATISVTATGVEDTWRLFGFIFNKASSSIRIDGAEAATGSLTFNDMDGITLNTAYGGSSPGGIDLGEVVIITGASSVTASSQIETYLNAKWAVY